MVQEESNGDTGGSAQASRQRALCSCEPSLASSAHRERLQGERGQMQQKFLFPFILYGRQGNRRYNFFFPLLAGEKLPSPKLGSDFFIIIYF